MSSPPITGPNGLRQRTVPGSGPPVDRMAERTAAARAGGPGTTQTLHIPSTVAYRALLAAPLVFWLGCIASGMAHHNGVPSNYQSIVHPLQWFDSRVLRPAGTLLPFGALALRAAAFFVHGCSAHGHAARPGAGAAPSYPSTARTPSLLTHCMVLYVGMAALRAAIYMAHLAFHGHGERAHLVSDHMTLAACIAACLHVELVVTVSDLTRHHDGSDPTCTHCGAKEVVLVTALVLNVFVSFLTGADMYFTTRYYHAAIESGATAFLGLIVFQAPAIWLVATHRRHK